jgi:DNA ligase-associated metallophosphoesterase
MISEIIYKNHHLKLLLEKVIWEPNLSAIFLADLHFGKAAHFRKSGIPIPEPIHQEDLNQLSNLILNYQPKDFYFLGDLFHSDWNEQWEVLNKFLKSFTTTKFHLIKGNHDVLSPIAYTRSSFEIHLQPLLLGDLLLSHEPLESVPMDHLNLCGHIHPGIRLVGKARQSVRIPVFHLRGNQLTLPAFGNFTGLALITPKAGDQIFGVTGKKIIQIL